MPNETRPDFATVDDVIELYRPLTESEQTRTAALLPVVSDRLRLEAEKVGMNLDAKAAESAVYTNVLRSVTVDIVARILMTPTESAGGLGPMTQLSESAGGYSASGTFLNPGGGLFIKNSELAALGIRRQRYGGLAIYADPRNHDQPLY